ncbi:MAG TPA: hypothetical protein VMB21_19295 [Candidatus Limnocylindria bacterium]|nr:hypothetical protein [Candidatus Limnocylindria bacterium]
MLFWFSSAALEFLIWLGNPHTAFLVLVVFCLAFTWLVYTAFRWVFWADLGILSLCLGVTVLQLQGPGWANGASTVAMSVRALIALGLILLHQLPSVRRWFGLHGRGKRWQTVFWLVTAGLTMLGQYILPTLQAFRE